MSYIDKWLYFPWLQNSRQDHLIHPGDLNDLGGLGIVKCIAIDQEYLVVENKLKTVRVRIEGIKKVLPPPKFMWNEKVFVDNNQTQTAEIDDLFWHHTKEVHNYYILFNGERKTKRYEEKDLS